MRNIWLVARRELGTYFRTPMGYVIVAIVLCVDGLLFNYKALGGDAKASTQVLELFFAFATFMTMVAGVMLAMRLVSEDRQLGTLTLLLTSPIRDHEIIAGKFLSGVLFLSMMTLLTVYMPLLIFVNGKVSLGHIASGYLGLILLGGLAVSIGLFASTISPNQVVSGVTAGAMMTAIYLCLLGAQVTEPPIRDFLAYISPGRHLNWQKGVITSHDMFYFVSSTYLFLMFSTQALRARRWR